jgi:hypothetical protein
MEPRDLKFEVMNLRHVVWLVVFTLGIKAVYLLFSLAVDARAENLYDQYVVLMKKNDAFWYEQIAVEGYREIRVKEEIGYSKGKEYTQSSWAFFPFYPLLNRYTMQILGIDYDLSALIWSLLFSLAALLAMYRFGCLFFNDSNKGFFNALVVGCFPFAFYFSAFYTEALFLIFTLFGFLAVHFKRYLALSFLLIPLVLLRPNGLIVLLPLYLYHLEQRGLLSRFRLDWQGLWTRVNILRSLAFATGPLSFLIFCLYQYQMTGFYFAFSIAQAGWYRKFMFPLLAFFRSGDLATQFNSIFAILVILFAFAMRKKLPLSFNVLVLLSLLMPLTSGSVTSMTRFVSVIFPLFLAFTTLVYPWKQKWIVLGVLVLLHLFSFYGWMANHPISF